MGGTSHRRSDESGSTVTDRAFLARVERLARVGRRASSRPWLVNSARSSFPGPPSARVLLVLVAASVSSAVIGCGARVGYDRGRSRRPRPSPRSSRSMRRAARPASSAPQISGTGQRRHLPEQRDDLLALLLPGLPSASTCPQGTWILRRTHLHDVRPQRSGIPSAVCGLLRPNPHRRGASSPRQRAGRSGAFRRLAVLHCGCGCRPGPRRCRRYHLSPGRWWTEI